MLKPLAYTLSVVGIAMACLAAAGAPAIEDPAYTKAIEKRADDVLAALALDDPAKSGKVRDAMLAQYRALKAWHDANDAELKDLGKRRSEGASIQARIDEIRASLKPIHDGFVARLSEVLTPDQVEKVKDKMTYNVVRVTYDAYCKMLPDLTAEQKAKVLDMLKQGREEAMDGGSSEEKHAIFGRYKGRINNYLSAEGYDLKTASKRLATTRPAAQTMRWKSPATGTEINGRVLEPTPGTTGPLATVIYLKNLSIPRLGREADETILSDLRKGGHLVLEFDYARHPKSISPDLQADVLKLRRDLAGKQLLGERPIDLAHVFILAEGFRLRRDVEFGRDAGRVLAMDIIYPSNTRAPVHALMEITCDNENRMGNGSLVFCHDTLLEGGMFAGFAVAMVDHPVAPPYKGLDDPMPQVIYRLKAAVRMLRATGAQLGLSGKIGAIGFSRGSNMAALLATTGDRADLEGDAAPHHGISSRIQAAMVHGGRFDYTRLRTDDPMLVRFEKAWGKREDNAERWASHGAAHYLREGELRCAAPPLFLNTSDAEAPEFRDQLAGFAERLKEAGVTRVYAEDADGRGHRVTTDPSTLAAVYAFFSKHLNE